VTLDAGRDADLFIEAAPEVVDIKQGLFEAADALLRDQAIIATNTSSLSVTRLATFTRRPDRFVGIHFFNPVPAMALVEVVRGLDTSDETVATGRAFAETVGKTPITVADSPGFVATHPVPDDQRGRVRAVRGGGQRRGDRRRHEAGRPPPDGPSGAG
jgi:3-hydroxybutyryl-CoA dehydrogenase